MKTLAKTTQCLECQELLGPGREDRKFCNDSCRTSYHNRKRKDADLNNESGIIHEELMAIHKICQILIRNRSILFNLSQHNSTSFNMRDLLAHGFNPKYFTSQCILSDGETFRFCFDLGYRILENEEVDIILRREEISY